MVYRATGRALHERVVRLQQEGKASREVTRHTVIRESRLRRPPILAMGILVMWLATVWTRGSTVLTPLIDFTGTNGLNPNCTLVQGTDGNFYGTAEIGGTNGVVPFGGYGTIFKMSPDSTVLWTISLDSTNGDTPEAALVEGKDGAFYGTAAFGGTRGGYGTIFRVTPSGTVTLLYSFCGGYNGSYPNAGLVQGPDGYLYGTTFYGGTNGLGTVYKVSTNGVFKSLYSFGAVVDANGNQLDGAQPFAGLAVGSDGTLYGVTEFGGTYVNENGDTDGILFKMTPDGVPTTLHVFTGGDDGRNPDSRPALGPDGNLYGTAGWGGQYDSGAYFRWTTNGVFTPLHVFPDVVSEGYHPNELVLGADGNFYTTANVGGEYAYGTVLRVSPTGAVTVLYAFGTLTDSHGNALDGQFPAAGVVLGTDGNLYGTAVMGGSADGGTVFRLSAPLPPLLTAPGQSGGTVSLRWSAVAGQTYQVQYKSSLTSATWSNLGSTNTATNGTAFAVDPDSPDAQRFYRVVLVP